MNSIGNRLQSADLVKDPDLFKRYLQYNGLDAGIEAGNFVLNQAMTIPQIGQVLQEGKIEELTVTIPEGKRIEEVAEIVAAPSMPNRLSASSTVVAVVHILVCTPSMVTVTGRP